MGLASYGLIKPNYFKKQSFSSSFLLTWSRYTGTKWPWSTRQDSSMHLRHWNSMLSTPLPFWTCIFAPGTKNWWWKTLLLRIIWLYEVISSDSYLFFCAIFSFFHIFQNFFKLTDFMPTSRISWRACYTHLKQNMSKA